MKKWVHRLLIVLTVLVLSASLASAQKTTTNQTSTQWQATQSFLQSLQNQINSLKAPATPNIQPGGAGQFAGYNSTGTTLSPMVSPVQPGTAGQMAGYSVNGSVVGPVNAANGNVNGVLNVQTLGADPTDTNDSTAAFNTAAAKACPGGICTSPIYVPAGTYQVTQLNFTNLMYFDMVGDGSSGGAGPGAGNTLVAFDCEEPTNDTGVCVDFSGDQYNTMDGIQVYAKSPTHSPHILVLMAKTTLPTGNSQSFDWRNDSFMQSGGSFGIYNYGGEIWHCSHCNENGIDGSPKVAGVFFSAVNTPGISSPFTTITSGQTSMTAVDWNDGSSGGTSGTGPSFVFDTGATDGVISDISISGYCNHSYNEPCIADYSSADTGKIRSLSIHDLRDEAGGSTAYPLLKLLYTAVWSVDIHHVTYASSNPLSGAAFTFANVGNGYIQADYTTILPTYGVSCTSGGAGLFIANALNNSGGMVQNNCLGGSSGMSITGGLYGQYESIYAGGYSPGSCTNSITGDDTSVCTTNATACTNGTTFASGGSTHCRLYCNGSNWIESGAGC